MHLSLKMLTTINRWRSTHANAQDRHLQVIPQHPALWGDERKGICSWSQPLESNGHFQNTTYSFVPLILGLCIMKDHTHYERFFTLWTRKANRSWKSKCSCGAIWALKETNPTKINLCFLFLLIQAWVMWNNRTQRCRKKYYIKCCLTVWANQKQLEVL